MEQERIIEIERILTEAHFQFAIKCLYRFMIIKPKNDFAFSPHSIYEGLLMVYFLSSGAIEERLKHILYLSDVPKYELIQYYSSRRDSELQSKNNASAASSDYSNESRCWIKTTNYKFNHLLPLKNIFNNGLKVFDPDNTPTEKIVRINMTIENSLKNRFLDPVKLSVVNDDMELVLMTASRLNVQKFQISTTYQSDGLNALNLFDKRKNNSFFSRELNVHVTEFLYTNENTSLFLFLPDSIISSDFSMRRFPIISNVIGDLIERLSTEEAICKLRNLLDSDTPSEDVTNFTISPIFYLERDMPMRALLRDLGIEELLKPDAINLDSFFVDDDSVHLGNVVHRICVNVTKKDTEAYAANVIYTGQETSKGPKHNSLIYNFPFVWLIYDKQRRNVLFAGAFNKFKRWSSSTL